MIAWILGIDPLTLVHILIGGFTILIVLLLFISYKVEQIEKDEQHK